MRTTLVACLSAALFALPLTEAKAAAAVAAAAQPLAPISMTGVSDTGDTVELRFDALPSKSGTLTIKGDRSNSPAKSFPVSYELEPVAKNALESPIVRITFDNHQKMTIACDPLSDNCHADGYPTVGGTSFSILWHITRADTKTAQARTHASP
ncbi:hypothetical protein [Paraburkholderia sp. C35]|uniref:hypothetical protein n=1 Tax=Paraburkholderia sp. C35 TaxID=2126993 RepID=UPI001EF5B34E|nr:hypothetical protein [Paraburkholderia sp. C35]